MQCHKPKRSHTACLGQGRATAKGEEPSEHHHKIHVLPQELKQLAASLMQHAGAHHTNALTKWTPCLGDAGHFLENTKTTECVKHHSEAKLLLPLLTMAPDRHAAPVLTLFPAWWLGKAAPAQLIKHADAVLHANYSIRSTDKMHTTDKHVNKSDKPNYPS